MRDGYPRKCFYCGKGLSQKWRVTPEERLILAIFNFGPCCKACAKPRVESALGGGK